MPMLKLLEKGKQLPWTKIPNGIMEHEMRDLKDTELRILLILYRYTKGWRMPRSSAFLTYGLLTRRTGRQPAAISRAIKNLQKKGYLQRTLELSTERVKNQREYIEKHQTKSEDNI